MPSDHTYLFQSWNLKHTYMYILALGRVVHGDQSRSFAINRDRTKKSAKFALSFLQIFDRDRTKNWQTTRPKKI